MHSRQEDFQNSWLPFKLRFSRYVILAVVVMVFVGFTGVNKDGDPVQPEDGPGGKTYLYAEVIMEDQAESKDGYWLFKPKGLAGPSERLIVFMHGYGAFNPMIYGGWISHLVKRGDLVVFPRYQKSLIAPGPGKFTKLAAKGIRDCVADLQEKKLLAEDYRWYGAGHSYGGVILTGIANDPDSYELPKPNSMILCSPGSGPFKGGVLESYEDIAQDTKIVIMVSEHDEVVGDVFGKTVFETTPQLTDVCFLRQQPDVFNGKQITAHHNECYSLDTAFDSGLRNFTTKRALRMATTDALDYYGYWKIFDALLDCSEKDKYCEFAFGGTQEQLNLGKWNDTIHVAPLINVSR